MNWLLVHTGGAHTGQDGFASNAHMRESLSIQHELRELGHEARVWGPRNEGYTPTHYPSPSWPDAVICLEQYETGWLPDFRERYPRALRFLWAIDLHCGAADHIRRITPQFDVILHSTRSLIQQHRRQFLKQDHWWFPNCYDPRWFSPDRFEKGAEWSVAFVGTLLGDREAWLAQLSRRLGYTVPLVFALGDDMVRQVRHTSVHLNRSLAKDVNYRCFETIGCGTVLCTDRLDEMADLGFMPGENCLMYSSVDEAADLLRELRKDPARRKRIERNAVDLARRHTYGKRVCELLSRIESGL